MRNHRGIAALLSAVLAAAALGCGRAPSFERAPDPASQSTAPAVASPVGTLSHQVRFEVGGTEMPGCFAADEPFQAVIQSFWGEMTSTTTLTHRWSMPPSGEDGVLVRVDGQDLLKRLDPGDAFPAVSINLPLENVTVIAKLNTFVFTDFDAEGRACFRWLNPPGTSPKIEIQPQPNTET